MKYIVKEIEVEFSKGSFEEWANGNDPKDPDYVARCETAYNEQIRSGIRKAFPFATVVRVGEGYDQLMYTRFDFVIEAATDSKYDYETKDEYDDIEAKVKQDLEAILGNVSNDGSFWNS